VQVRAHHVPAALQAEGRRAAPSPELVVACRFGEVEILPPERLQSVEQLDQLLGRERLTGQSDKVWIFARAYRNLLRQHCAEGSGERCVVGFSDPGVVTQANVPVALAVGAFAFACLLAALFARHFGLVSLLALRLQPRTLCRVLLHLLLVRLLLRSEDLVVFGGRLLCRQKLRRNEQTAECKQSKTHDEAFRATELSDKKFWNAAGLGVKEGISLAGIGEDR